MRKLCLLFGTLILMNSCSTEPSQAELEWQGHRGARGAFPENTIPAFLYALDEGMNTLEMDVVVTSDEKLVVSHEPFFHPQICNANFPQVIRPDTLGEGNNIYQWTYGDISYVDCGLMSHPKFPNQKKIPAVKPLLSAVIDTAEARAKANNLPAPNYNIEIKSRPEWDNLYHPEIEEYASLLVDLLKNKGVLSRVVIQSFDKRPLQFLYKEYPSVKLALLVEDNVSAKQHIADLGFTPEIYSCYFPLVDEELVNYCHKNGMRIIPWTVNSIEEITRLSSMGVDGIITDYPQLKRELSFTESD